MVINEGVVLILNSQTSLSDNIINRTQIVSSNSMRLIRLILNLRDKKLITMTVFLPSDNFPRISLVVSIC